jgi:hypothetical protein
MNAQPYLDRGCNRCPANCHEYSLDEARQVKGLCGDTRPQGGCYGLIFVPYINPSRQVLGIRAKSLHKTGQLKRKPSTGFGKIENREIRYSLQRTAQTLLYDIEARKQHRTCGCGRNIQSDGVAVYRTLDGTDARFGNLITCGNVWTCPVCSAKVTEQRRLELQQGITAAIKAGGAIALLTLTFSHGLGDQLADNLEKFTKAVTRFKNSRAYGRMKDCYGIEYQRRHSGEMLDVSGGAVRSLEVTYGVNGWHPHTHDLVFLRSDEALKDYRLLDELKREWVKCCLNFGLGDQSKINDMMERGLTLQGGDYAAEYVAKFGREPKLMEGWSAAREVTKGMSKIGGGEHATPFMLLAWAQQGDEQAAALFKEYAKVFEGRRMLTWSPGLKAHLLGNEEETTDEELAQLDDQVPEEELVYRLDVDQWKLVMSRNARYELLLVAARNGESGVDALLEELETRTPSHSGWFLDHCRPRFDR